MSSVAVIPILVPIGIDLAGGLMIAVLSATAEMMDMQIESGASSEKRIDECSVDIPMPNASEVTAGASQGQRMVFTNADVRLEFYLDDEGKSAVRVSGKGTEEELRRLGEKFANTLAQQYAYHRLMTEMKARNMNVVEEEVEEDGTVRMLVRLFQN